MATAESQSIEAAPTSSLMDPSLIHLSRSSPSEASITTSMDTSSMSTSRYGGVIFKDVNESYKSDGDIVIRYVNKSGYEEGQGDMIGLFAIGWKNVKEAITTVKALDHVTEEGTNDNKLIMSSTAFADKVKDGQFYQLCYIRDGETVEVIGASCPFMIKKEGAGSDEDVDDMVMVLVARDKKKDGQESGDEDDEFYVVESESQLLKKRVDHLSTNNDLLTLECKSLYQKLTASKEDVLKLESQLFKTRNEKVKLEGLLKNGQDTVQHVTHLLSEIRGKESNHEATIGKLVTENNQLKAQVNLLSRELQVSNEEHKVAMRDANLIKSDNQETMAMVSRLLDEKEHLLFEKETLVLDKETLMKTIAEKDALLASANSLGNDLSRLNSERSMYLRENNQLKEENSELIKQHMDLKSENSQLKSQLEELKLRMEYNESQIVNKMKKLEIDSKKFKEERNQFKAIIKSINKSTGPQVVPRSSRQEVACQETQVKVPDVGGQQVADEDGRQQQPTTPNVSTASSVSTTSTETDIFMDDFVTLPCSLCHEEVFCTVKDMKAMTIHLEQVHKQRVCPVCSQLFDETMEGINEYFHLHVENHFDNPRMYPSLGSGFEAIGGAN